MNLALLFKAQTIILSLGFLACVSIRVQGWFLLIIFSLLSLFVAHLYSTSCITHINRLMSSVHSFLPTSSSRSKFGLLPCGASLNQAKVWSDCSHSLAQILTKHPYKLLIYTLIHRSWNKCTCIIVII